MDHLVCLEADAKELENLINRKKSMILRGADVIKVPHSSVEEGDVLYLINSSFEQEVTARGVVTCVVNSGKLSLEESYEMIIRNQDRLQLPDLQFERIAGKRYLIMISLDNIERIVPFRVDKSLFAGFDDWLPVGDINTVLTPDASFR
jgi:hypothetical protein